MTDCFQPCELQYRVTLKTIEILNKYGIGYLIVTKSHHVADDEYMNIMDKRLAHIQITVTTTDDKKSLEYEIEYRDRLSRAKRWKQMDEDVVYAPSQLDRDIVNPSQIRTVVRSYREIQLSGTSS